MPGNSHQRCASLTITIASSHCRIYHRHFVDNSLILILADSQATLPCRYLVSKTLQCKTVPYTLWAGIKSIPVSPLSTGAKQLPSHGRFFHFKRCSAVKRHRVGTFTNLFLPGACLSYQQSRTGGVIPGSTRQHAATSGADRKSARFAISTLQFTTHHRS